MDIQRRTLENLKFLSDSGWTIMVGGTTIHTLTATYNEKNDITQILPDFKGEKHDLGFDYCRDETSGEDYLNGDLRRLVSNDNCFVLWIQDTEVNERKSKKAKNRRDYHIYKKDEPNGIYSRRILDEGFRFRYDWERRRFLSERTIQEAVKVNPQEEESTEKFYRGEYLGFFAESLVTRGFGHVEFNKYHSRQTYRFLNHHNLNKLVVLVERDDMGFLGATTYDVTLTGPEWQVKEFKRAAESQLDNTTHSLKCVKKQLVEKQEESQRAKNRT